MKYLKGLKMKKKKVHSNNGIAPLFIQNMINLVKFFLLVEKLAVVYK